MKYFVMTLFIFFVPQAFAKQKTANCIIDQKKSCEKCNTISAQCGASDEVIFLSLQTKPISISLQIFNSKNGTELTKEISNKIYTIGDMLKIHSESDNAFKKLYPEKQSFEKIEMTHVQLSEDINIWKTADTTKSSPIKLSKIGNPQKRGLASTPPAGSAGGINRAQPPTE